MKMKMKIETDSVGNIILKEVFSGIILKTEDGETLSICMRDTGFEFNYNRKWYEAKEGKLKEMK